MFLTLQSLRGIAALLVVLYHASHFLNEIYHTNFLYGAFKNGYLGVDLFFVLSGFIIYYIHHQDLSNRTKLNPFLTKRFIRVYPVYWVVLLTMIPVYFLVPSFGEQQYRDTEVIIKAFLLYPQEHNIIAVAWTLSHEILFYLLFAVAIVLPRKISVSIMAIWAILSLIFGNTFLFSSFNLEFVTGMVVAYVALSGFKYNKFLIPIGTVLFIVSLVNLILPRFILGGIASGALILGCVLYEINNKVKVPRFMSFLGDASYSIYLTHYPLLSVLNKVFYAFGVYEVTGYNVAGVMMVVIAVLMGCMFHTIIEKPILAMFRKRTVIKNIALERA